MIKIFSKNDVNRIKFYKNKIYLHQGYKFNYYCLIHNPRNSPITNQYEKWPCEKSDELRCQAYLIIDRWNENKIKLMNTHNHAPIEELKDYDGEICKDGE